MGSNTGCERNVGGLESLTIGISPFSHMSVPAHDAIRGERIPEKGIELHLTRISNLQ